MQIPLAILQPIARTISSIVFPAIPDRATNRKTIDLSRSIGIRDSTRL